MILSILQTGPASGAARINPPPAGVAAVGTRRSAFGMQGSPAARG
jgi:hypothetical protein